MKMEWEMEAMGKSDKIRNISVNTSLDRFKGKKGRENGRWWADREGGISQL